METLRSAETLRKEYDLQAEFTARIRLKLQEVQDQEGNPYGEILQDLAVYANELRKVAPPNTLVILHPRPEVIMIGEGDGYQVRLFIHPNCWRFDVNSSERYDLDKRDNPPLGQYLRVGKNLKRLWDTALQCLPEGFIIRGSIDPKHPEEEIRRRTRIQQWLGFSLPQTNNQVYGIMRDRKLQPLGLEEFLTLTKQVPNELSQKLSVRKVNWPGA